ncbi:hypothetical protein CAEBREN_12597 [Caenorhabditis brenneri]|uniref:Lin-15A/B-like domain-containing protein n=1 Tax=Caenorhabditis brenneri TaxID=135651 RepID=G0N186_CAEBE|nr:hypothetical protein CAEBREN_12597 [Caenorhabditis brenneri]
MEEFDVKPEEVPENITENSQKSPKQEEIDVKPESFHENLAENHLEPEENEAKLPENDKILDNVHENSTDSQGKLKEDEIKIEEKDETFEDVHENFLEDPSKIEEQYEKSGVYLGEFPENTIKMEEERLKFEDGDINVESYEEVYAEEEQIEDANEISVAMERPEEEIGQKQSYGIASRYTAPLLNNNKYDIPQSSSASFNITNYTQPKRTTPIANNRCSLCTRFVARPALKTIQKTEEKLLIMTAYLIKNHLTITEARLFIHKTRYKLICRSHFPELLDTIFKAIGIKTIDKIDSCSRELRDNVLNLMKPLDASFDPKRFEEVVKDFVKRNFKQDRNDVSLPITPRRRFPTKNCVICHKNIPACDSTSVTARDVRVVFMLGSMLKEEKTLHQAHEFLFYEDRCVLCQNHFFETLQEISKYLGIDNFESIHLAPSEKVQELMDILKQLNPYFTVEDFFAAVRIFTLRIYNIYNKTVRQSCEFLSVF